MAAVLQNTNLSDPFQMPSHQRVNAIPHIPTAGPSSRSAQPLAAMEMSSPLSPPTETSSKTFNRFRSSLEQSLRTATRTKKPPHPPNTEITSKGKNKEYTKSEATPKEKEKSSMLKRIESKVTFRKAVRDSNPSTPSAGEVVSQDKVRVAGFTSFITPSLRQASMSSPALHLASQALPSPKSQSAVPASSSSGVEVLVSPARERARRSSLQPQQRDISNPAPLIPKRENGGAVSVISREPSQRHRATKSNPTNNSTQPPLPSTPTGPREVPREIITPPRNTRSPPGTPTPGSRNQLVRSSSRTATHSPALTSRTSSPSHSPIGARSPTTRIRVVTPVQRGLTSSSSSHVPLSPSPSPIRRPSLDSPRTSTETQRRPSVDISRSSVDSPFKSGSESPPPVRRRAVSPGQRSYSQNRHFNISSTSLISPSNPEHRELIRSATSVLCKEMIKIPLHMTKTESGIREWEEVELRMRALSRAERVWSKSTGNTGSPVVPSSPGPFGLSVSAEEREKRLFCDALRDGYVLCQLMNKLRSTFVVRPDPKDDGIVRCNNVAKFLAACASYGLPDENLFQKDDLIEATSESLFRVAKTIIALVAFADLPTPPRTKHISGQNMKTSHSNPSSPYNPNSVSRASASTPNLRPTSTSPTPVRKRWSPPSELPTLSSSSSDEINANPSQVRISERHDEVTPTDVPVVMTPPPRSPLRARPAKRSEDGGLYAWARKAASPITTSTTGSARPSSFDVVPDPMSDASNIRQSVASSAITDTTVTTRVSSILDVTRNSSGGNKFGTIRTVTTDITSEAPSITRTEGSAISNDLTRRKSMETNVKQVRERKKSDVPILDLSRVVEEMDDTLSSREFFKDKKINEPPKEIIPSRAEKQNAVNLRKGKWPDDFFDAFPAPSQPRLNTPNPPGDQEGSISYPPNAISISPPRKLAIARRNESPELLSQFPRRPSQRARKSTDGLILVPKESILRRDTSPDDAPAANSRGILRRNSTKPSIRRNGAYVPRKSVEEPRSSDSDSPVPFPRRVSGDYAARTPSPRSSPGAEPTPLDERPRFLRGRFQSDVESSSSKRGLPPSPYEDSSAKPSRTRFESMVNLGVASGTASASDIMNRDSIDGSAVRMTLVVREDGKPPTHFQLGNCIGRGQFGSVYRALNLNTGQMVAVKRIRLEGLKEEEVTTLMREVDIVKSLSHPSIVKYEGMARDHDTLNIVLEYAENGSLGQTLKAFGRLNERLVASYVVKILEGLHYLHRSHVVHCDLKAANILTTKNGNVKLSDFGVSLNLRAMEREMKDVAGTPNWMAPEVIELKGASTKSDIWSLACTIIELLTGRPPYADISNSMSVMFRIVEDKMPPLPEGCSSLLQDFLKKCFHKDPSQRPDAELLFEHPWLQNNWNALKDLRPQDSIPFLRRVSVDLQKSEAVRYLSNIEIPESPVLDTVTFGDDSRNASPIGPRSSASNRPSPDDNISPREHAFVKTTFSKPMICRVCLMNVKKSAVLCAQCSLISHSKCAIHAPPTCDLRAQLLLYAQYAEQGNPTSAYSNPADTRDDRPKPPMSNASSAAHSARTSVDAHAPATSQSPQNSPTPPSAFKFISAFKRSRSFLVPDQKISEPSSSTSNDKGERLLRKRSAVLRKRSKERPLSMTSDSTGPSSLQSAATAAESLSSRQTRRKSNLSSGDTDTRQSGSGFSAAGEVRTRRTSRMASVSEPSELVTDAEDTSVPGIPGSLPDTRGHKKRDSKLSGSGCLVQ